MRRLMLLFVALLGSDCGPDRRATAPMHAVTIERPPAALVGDAGVAEAQIEAAPPEVPNQRPFDPTLHVEHGLLAMGTSDRELACLSFGYWVVLDLASGCATETRPQSPVLEELSDAELAKHRPRPSVEALLRDSRIQAAIREEVNFGRRFGYQALPFAPVHITWSRDGRDIFVIANNRVYRSNDAGRSYQAVLVGHDWSARISPDGQSFVMRPLYETVALSTHGASAPQRLASLPSMFLEWSPSSRARLTRAEPTELCLDEYEPLTGQRASAQCVATPPPASGLPFIDRRWDAVSPNGHFALMRVSVGRQPSVLSLVDLTRSQVTRTFSQSLGGDVDDVGNAIVHALTDAADAPIHYVPFAAPPASPVLVARGAVLWHDARRGLRNVPHSRGETLGPNRCNLARPLTLPVP